MSAGVKVLVDPLSYDAEEICVTHLSPPANTIIADSVDQLLVEQDCRLLVVIFRFFISSKKGFLRFPIIIIIFLSSYEATQHNAIWLKILCMLMITVF